MKILRLVSSVVFQQNKDETNFATFGESLSLILLNLF